jgi:hypothetical protein
MSFLLINFAISTFLIITTTILYYEVLRFTWSALPKLSISPRNRMVFVVLSIFAGHTIAVWIYGVAYWVMVNHLGMGSLGNDTDIGFLTYVYFSAETYSSLGIGDIYPEGSLKFIAGVEVLNGLVLIGWSVSFTYLAMEKFWDLHPHRENKKE